VARIRVGCCGFPVGRERYARKFAVVEVQQTFYQPPAPETLARWRARLPAPFELTLKAWQLITHEASSPTYRRLREKFTAAALARCGAFRPSREVQRAWQRTFDAARTLEARIVLFQCPASFTPAAEHIANLRRFFGRVERGGLVFAWEPRGGWAPELVRKLCRELDLVHAVDPFRERPLGGALRYFRLHGRTGYRYRYTRADLAELAGLCRGRLPAYVLFNNVSMWEDAQRFAALLGKSSAR
jgi:uncharacterized protein YecE (DUF72 family)